MKVLSILVVAFSLLCYTAEAQTHSSNIDYDGLITNLEGSTKKGQKRSLRDLGSLLDNPALNERIAEVLYKRTFFTKEELSIKSNLPRDTFLKFYYDNEDEISFSPLLEAFYLQPLEKHPVEYKTRELKVADEQKGNRLLRQYILEMDSCLAVRSFEQLPQQVEYIAALKKEEAYQFLLELLLDERLQELEEVHQKDFYLAVAEALVEYPEMESLRAMLMLVGEQFIATDKSIPLLARLTNIHLPLATDSDELVEQYEYLMDSLGALEIMRQHGYDRLFRFRSNFFHEQVDYYGKLLNESTPYPWIQHNAFLDLVESEHPRAMFYLASQIYKLRHSQSIYAKQLIRTYINGLEKLTKLEVGIKIGEKTYDFNPYQSASSDLQRKIVIYWAKHYEDYEWDDNYLSFTNKYIAEEITQNYERLFRRLNSRNDSVAMLSFVQLTEGEAGKVMELAQKYRQLLRTYNASLPSFKHKYLEALVQLTDFCRRHGIAYKLPSAHQSKAEKLLNPASPAERYHLENELIEQLSLKELTALEYMACLNESNTAFSYSVGRILDHFYSRHWKDILLDDAQLRLYLKKSQLFEGIGVFGSCNYYLIKFNTTDPELQSKLHRMGRVESDEGILNQMMQLVVEVEEGEDFGLIDFLDTPTLFDKHDINILPSPTQEDLETIFQQIRVEGDPDVIRQLFYYLRLHPSMEMIPLLFSLIDDERVLVRREGMTVMVADFTIPLIEEVYDYSFPVEGDAPFATNSWRSLWSEKGSTYKDWGSIFYEERLKKILEVEEIKVEQLNKIMDSPFFGEAQKKICLEALHKVKPVKDIKRLIFEPKLSVEKDLVYFADFFFSYKELDDITKLFNINNDNAGQMLDYLSEKATQFSISEKGSFYNNLFRQLWLTNFLNNGQCRQEMIVKIREALEVYLDESDYLSEYEEQATNLHIAQIDNIGRSVFEKLQSSLQLDLDEASKGKIQQTILATVSYQELGGIARLLSDLSRLPGRSPFQFLNKDFGLPIYELNDVDALETFIQKHEELSEFEFYFHYLKAFGVDFLKADGQSMDFQKIYDILQFDIVSPFVSRTGGKRDYFSYGIIKLLELKFDD
ncbi:MAG: hypothetical protein AAF990_27310, partial [Bacteroidota bacterium]